MHSGHIQTLSCHYVFGFAINSIYSELGSMSNLEMIRNMVVDMYKYTIKNRDPFQILVNLTWSCPESSHKCCGVLILLAK